MVMKSKTLSFTLREVKSTRNMRYIIVFIFYHIIENWLTVKINKLIKISIIIFKCRQFLRWQKINGWFYHIGMIMWNKGYIGYFILSRREVVQEHDRSLNSNFSILLLFHCSSWLHTVVWFHEGRRKGVLILS